MRRLAVIVLVLACAAVVAIVAVSLGDDDDGDYQVRAIFDTAFAVIPGEDVKVAGVKVGQVRELDVTPDKKAAIVLDITEPGFGDFRQDATCIVRPQSLIGEKFVECTPTQPRPEGEAAPPPLRQITEGEGKGQYLLPVTNTRKSVDLDLINDIYQLPERERLTIILNELGTGLAARGEDLNDVIRRANPALLETDKVLAILRQQNQVLADLATESDRVLAPLARRKEQVADFITQARDVAQATAQERGALEQSFAKLPRFLSELRPTLQELGALSDQMTPVLTDLGAQAGDINRLVEQLGPLSQSARPAFRTLGEASEVGTRAVREIRPITRDVNTLAQATAPLAADLSDLLVSLRDTGGIERAMDWIFFQMTAINGFDRTGHYLRAGLLINACSTYATELTTGCEANFQPGGATRSTSDGGSLYLRRQDALLRGMPLEEVLRAYPAPGDGKGKRPATAAATTPRDQHDEKPLALPDAVLPGSDKTAPVAAQRATAPDAEASATGQLMDYLLGGGG